MDKSESHRGHVGKGNGGTASTCVREQRTIHGTWCSTLNETVPLCSAATMTNLDLS